MADRFEDHRGVIQDLVGETSITAIHTVKGAVRGNHVHKKTTQWTLVTKGVLLMAYPGDAVEVHAGEVFAHEPGEAHAWKALVDTDCLVFTLGPRSGENYEEDTYRLEEPLL